jgi:hypothetical protein
MNITNKPEIRKDIPFKLSEIVTHGRGSFKSDSGPVCYSWHKKGKASNPDSYALCVFFTTKILDEIRFRDGDKVDISFNQGTATFTFNPSNPFSVYKSSGTKFMMKVSTRGIEALMQILPDTGKPESMAVIMTETGIIHCSI